MRNTTDNYLILGLRASGKTTYFSVMAQHLQDVTNRTNYLRFRYLPTEINNIDTGEKRYEEITSDFIDDCMNRLNRQKWPLKTLDYEFGYSFEIVKFFRFLGKPIFKKYFYRTSIIEYHDYPGEAFSIAFGGEENPATDQKMKNVADEINKRISSATGIFLLLDADAMFIQQDTQKLKKSLIGLFRTIKLVVSQ